MAVDLTQLRIEVAAAEMVLKAARTAQKGFDELARKYPDHGPEIRKKRQQLRHDIEAWDAHLEEKRAELRRRERGPRDSD